MNEKFAALPLDEDTKVLARRGIKLGSFDAIHERWQFEAIKAESLILVSEEIALLADEELEELLRGSHLMRPGSPVTIKRGNSGYTFINFNFETN